MRNILPVCVVGTAIALAVLLAGCSGSFCVGSGCSISGDDVAKEAGKQLDKTLQAHGRPPLPPVTCPHDLDKKKGATTRCFAKGDFGGGQTGTLGITATVTRIHNDTAELHFETDKRLKK